MSSKGSYDHIFTWAALVAALLFVGFYFAREQVGQSERVKSEFPVISDIGEFTFTNQHGQLFGSTQMKGKFWVADVFFSRCPTLCLTMTRNMGRLRDALKDEPLLGFVSLSSDPDFDTPEVLNVYAKRMASMADSEPEWHFLTGKKEEVYKTVLEGFRLAATEKKAEERESPTDLVIHSSIFVIVDPSGKVRSSLDGGDDFLLEVAIEKIKSVINTVQ